MSILDMNLEAAATELEQLLGRPVSRDESLAMRTTWRIGGPADLFADARSAAELAVLVLAARRYELPLLILGKGSNVLVDDRGFRGLVVGNRAHYTSIDGQSGEVIAESGVSQPHLARQTAEMGLGGLAWAVAIPGSVGGGVISNAGAFGGCFADVLQTVTLVDPNADVSFDDLAKMREDGLEGAPGISSLPKDELQFGYRMSRFRAEMGERKDDRIILSTRFQLHPANREELQTNIATWTAQRRQKQPTEPSAGSTFKNPPGTHAGRLIEEVGLKGTQRGEIVISPRHANFFVNMGAGSSNDVRALMDMARNRVVEQFGIELVPEVVYIG
jgi:UDP-N-acetylmuramate dehydrogenase